MLKYEKPDVEFVDFCINEYIMDVADYSEGYGGGGDIDGDYDE